ncbi:hypothetical protein EV207_102265 [Scopulibacillus darangshiensis]|uniref:HTH cro/C1-type domain-containing protein n=1 Tax=Scopulibacillus darangshiensis TaxID=442528 RepID=A0A4R2PA01_9BACL|nr:helix-turn-helix transcriptional regulator [Scopulibacillus darangshiensis]TCP31772.1 hypothetical protein EV207_102265 [Scopulibacillus darangshiensis]
MNAALYNEIQHFIEKKGWNKTKLANNTGIHISEISRVFNHKQPLSFRNLDAITKAFGLAKGTLYSFYIEECFNEKRHLDKRRSEQFLYKCAAEGYEGHTHDILNAMIEEKSKTIRSRNLKNIFSVAEKLFNEGKEQQALPLYEAIIENEADRFSEHLATSYFRRFYIVRMTGKGQLALAHVLEHLAYMPKEIKIDAYLWITAYYYLREQWEEVLYFSERLAQMVTKGEYYGRALMYKSFALRRLGGSLEDVLELTERYGRVNAFFSEIAEGNRFVALLDFGRLECVDDYLAWLDNRNDIFVGLPRLLEAYAKLRRFDDASKLLKKYHDAIDDMVKSQEPYKQQMYLYFRYAHALYLCMTNHTTEGLNELLDVAALASQIGNIERLKQCLLVYWEYREQTTPELESRYRQLLNSGENCKTFK